jgi:membrane associated rhomboid family serine protease
MIVLYSFGSAVEHYFQDNFGSIGTTYYLALFFGSVVFSNLWSLFKQKDNPYYNAVGASGAVSAVVFSSIILYPSGKIFLFLIPVPIPAPVFGILYVAYEYYMAKNSRDNIGHDAHLWGAVFGVVYTVALKPGLILKFMQEIGLA